MQCAIYICTIYTYNTYVRRPTVIYISVWPFLLLVIIIALLFLTSNDDNCCAGFYCSIKKQVSYNVMQVETT